MSAGAAPGLRSCSQNSLNKLMSYTEHMSSRGLIARSRIIAAKVIENEQEVAARLGLSSSSRMVKIERLRVTGEDPFALELCYLPAPEFAALVSAPLSRGSLFATLEHDYKVELAYADEEVDATAADQALARMLGLAKGRTCAAYSSGDLLEYGEGDDLQRWLLPI